MTVKANTFIWINEPTKLDDRAKNVLETVQDTGNTRPPHDSREKFKDQLKPKSLRSDDDILLSKDGTLRIRKSQYTEDMTKK